MKSRWLVAVLAVACVSLVIYAQKAPQIKGDEEETGKLSALEDHDARPTLCPHTMVETVFEVRVKGCGQFGTTS